MGSRPEQPVSGPERNSSAPAGSSFEDTSSCEYVSPEASGASEESGASEGSECCAGDPSAETAACCASDSPADATSADESAPGGAGGHETSPDAEDGAPDGEPLTVDDILDAEQSDAAAGASDLPAGEQALLADLKRLQAEYATYRRRTEAQREVEISRARGEVARALIPVLDDLDRAAQHGDLEDGSPFAAVGAKIRSVVERLGVVAFGEQGDTFDPHQHEAIFQQPTPGATVSTVLEVVEPGYRIGEIELRPAKVVVQVPAE